jgi:hypothetical protein
MRTLTVSLLKIIVVCAGMLWTFSSQAQSNIDTVSFETYSYRIVLDSVQTNNLWQIGTPAKAVFTQAFAGTRALVTDTVQPYPIGNTSSFYLAFELYGLPYIEFTHRFDTDTLGDGGYVELSVDSGATWILLSDTTNINYASPSIPWGLGAYGVYTTNFYGPQDTLIPAPLGFSGNSNGWITSTIHFPCFAIKRPFDLMLRFTFVSDSLAGGRDGWMIDNIVVYNEGGCGSVDENTLSVAHIFPNPSSGTSTLQLAEHLYAQAGTLSIYSLTGREVVRQVFAGNRTNLHTEGLAPGVYNILVKDKGKPIAQARLLVQ